MTGHLLIALFDVLLLGAAAIIAVVACYIVWRACWGGR